MFIFLQYCKISRVSQVCRREAKSDSFRINYNFLPTLLNWNWCDIIPVKRKARQLHIHWHILICANGKGDGSGSRSPTTSFLLKYELCTGAGIDKRERVFISPELEQNVYFLLFLDGWKVLWIIVIQYHFFDRDLNIRTAFYLSQAGAGQAAPVTQAQCFCCSLLVRGNFEAEGERQFSVGFN